MKLGRESDKGDQRLCTKGFGQAMDETDSESRILTCATRDGTLEISL